jgi:hypothetical protein
VALCDQVADLGRLRFVIVISGLSPLSSFQIDL